VVNMLPGMKTTPCLAARLYNLLVLIYAGIFSQKLKSPWDS